LLTSKSAQKVLKGFREIFMEGIGHETNGYFGGNNDSDFWLTVAVSECC